MARIRSIKPSFAGDSKVARLSLQARLTFLLLLPEADDEGRMVGTSKRLVGALYPNDEKIGPAQLERWLVELEREDMIVRYTADGSKYLAISNFRKHQNPQHPTASSIPPPPEPLTSASRNPRERVPKPSPLSVEEGRVEEGRVDIAPASADAEVDPLPSPRPQRPPDQLWDAMLDACGIGEPPTTSARGAYNRARKDLADVGATPAEVHRRAGIFRRRWPGVSLTPNGLAKQWAMCAVEPAPSANGRPATTVDRSIANILEDRNDPHRGGQDPRGPGYGLASTRALEAGT